VKKTIFSTIKKRTPLTYIAIFFTTITLIYIPVFSYMHEYRLSNFLCAFIFLYVFSLILEKQFPSVSKHIVILTANAGILLYASAFGYTAGIQYILFSFLVIPFILFRSDEWAQTILSVFQSIACFLGLEAFDYSFYPHTLSISSHHLIIIRYLMIVTTIFILSFSIWLYRFNLEKLSHERDCILIESLDEKVKTIKKIVIALNHIINNHLTLVVVNSSIISKSTCDPHLAKLTSSITEKGYTISYLLKKLTRLKKPAETEYAEGIMMLDIERSEYDDVVN
jgi:hypothetical protein